MAPPGRPNTSVAPAASRQRMIASAPVMVWVSGLSTGRHLTVGVSLELRAAGRMMLQRLADGLAHLPGRIRAPAGDLVGGGDALGLHLVDCGGDRPPDVAPAQAVRENHGD